MTNRLNKRMSVIWGKTSDSLGWKDPSSTRRPASAIEKKVVSPPPFNSQPVPTRSSVEGLSFIVPESLVVRPKLCMTWSRVSPRRLGTMITTLRPVTRAQTALCVRPSPGAAAAHHPPAVSFTDEPQYVARIPGPSREVGSVHVTI